MSLAHVRLIRSLDDQKQAIYKVESFDFTEDREWSEIGKLTILKCLKDLENG